MGVGWYPHGHRSFKQGIRTHSIKHDASREREVQAKRSGAEMLRHNVSAEAARGLAEDQKSPVDDAPCDRCGPLPNPTRRQRF